MSTATMKPLGWIVPLALGAAATFLYVRWHAEPALSSAPSATRAAAAAPLATRGAARAAEAAAAEPAVTGDSDSILGAALVALIGQQAFDTYIVPTSLVRHIVATV